MAVKFKTNALITVPGNVVLINTTQPICTCGHMMQTLQVEVINTMSAHACLEIIVIQV